jgi:hypothetical protein
VCSGTEHVFNLKHYFVSKSFAAVREAFNNAYPDNKVPNKNIHRLVTKFLNTGIACLYQLLIERKTAVITATPISSSASAATVG